MAVRRFRVVVFSLALLLGGLAQASEPGTHAPGSKVRLEFVASPYADFLFYLLHRDNAAFPQLTSEVPLNDVAPLTSGTFLPGYATASGARSYDDLYKVAYSYENSAALVRVLKQGQGHFARFEAFWHAQVAPQEQSVIQAWMTQEAEGDVVGRLEKLARMPFPYASVRVAVIGLGSLGRAIQNPPTMFATTEDASLPSVVGYQGTRMMLGAKSGDWRHRRDASRAISLIAAHGGTDFDVEEALCLLMQARLAQAFGTNLPPVEGALANTPRYALLRAMQRDWPRYEATTSLNALDFAIDEAIKTFGSEQVAAMDSAQAQP